MILNLKSLIISLIISLGVGGLSSILTKNSSEIYNSLNRPPLSPPSWLFPIVWIILYILMGISSYIIYESSVDTKTKNKALTIYLLQLAVNFVWPILFFNLEMFLFSFVWLIFLIVLVLYMTVSFYNIKPLAAYLQIPYIIWLFFAAYLNLMVYILN